MKHGQVLSLERCPHCSVSKPTLAHKSHVKTTDHAGGNPRFWSTYICTACGGVTLAVSPVDSTHEVSEVWPAAQEISKTIPARAREYLSQAVASLHSPAGAVMLAACAVDAMLKEKGLVEGSLYARINEAEAKHLITADMAGWAHEVRLDANEQRHADDSNPMPSDSDARRVVEFARALARFLFELPALVARGRKAK